LNQFNIKSTEECFGSSIEREKERPSTKYNEMVEKLRNHADHSPNNIRSPQLQITDLKPNYCNELEYSIITDSKNTIPISNKSCIADIGFKERERERNISNMIGENRENNYSQCQSSNPNYSFSNFESNAANTRFGSNMLNKMSMQKHFR